MRILIADDNDANRILAASILERDGHIVVTALNGKTALMECEGVKFDLILLDILMPIMNGIKTIKALRRHSSGRNANTPVFALTVYSSESDYRMFKQVGFDFVLPKPLHHMDVEQAWKTYKTSDSLRPNQTPEKHYNRTPVVNLEHWTHPRSDSHKNFWQNTTGCIELIKDIIIPARQSITLNLNDLRHAAHRLKGCAASLGLNRLETLSMELQNAPPKDISRLVDDLEECALDSRLVILSSL